MSCDSLILFSLSYFSPVGQHTAKNGKQHGDHKIDTHHLHDDFRDGHSLDQLDDILRLLAGKVLLEQGAVILLRKHARERIHQMTVVEEMEIQGLHSCGDQSRKDADGEAHPDALQQAHVGNLITVVLHLAHQNEEREDGNDVSQVPQHHVVKAVHRAYEAGNPHQAYP